MKRNLVFLLVGILAVSPVSAGMQVFADTDITNTVISADLPADEEELLQNDDTAEAVDLPAASESVSPESTGAAAEAAVPLSSFVIVSAEQDISVNAALEEAATSGTPYELFAGTSVSLSLALAQNNEVLAEASIENEDTAEKKAEEPLPSDLIWECSNPEILSLDENGTVTGLQEGDADISVSFTVNGELQTISLAIHVKAPEADAAAEALPEEAEAPLEEAAAAATQVEATAAEATQEEAAAAEAPQEEAAAEATQEEAIAQETAREELNEQEIIQAETEAQNVQADAADSASLYISSGTDAAVASAESKVSTVSTVSGSWKKTNGVWKYIQNNGSPAVGMQLIDGFRYYFNNDGSMLVGWLKYQNAWYYFDASGAMQSEWLYDKGHWYYLDPAKDCAMLAETFFDYKDDTYYLNRSGAMHTGWLELSDDWYAFSRSGAKQSGWLYAGGKWYYLDPSNDDIMVSNEIRTINGRSYIFSSSGAMLTSGWQKYKNTYYYIGKDGETLTGSHEIDGKQYYLDPARKGAMVTGPFKVGNNTYIYANSGSLVKNGWVKSGNDWYYGDSEGKMQKGWLKLGSKWYFLGSDGKMATGWIQWKNKWCYMGSDGVMLADTFVTVNGKRYYLGSDGYMPSSCWICVKGTWYYADGNGALKTGTATINGSTYEFNSDGSWIVSTSSYSNRTEFIALMAKLVRKYAPQYGVKVYSPIIAQAILESAYGESSLGKKYNNFFGLKCGTLWKGKSVSLKTGEEYSPGTYTTITANFRVYDSIEEGVRGYFVFLFDGRTRYNNLIGVTDPRTYLQNIKNDGYATSSKYVDNCMNVVKKYNLTQYDD